MKAKGISDAGLKRVAKIIKGQEEELTEPEMTMEEEAEDMPDAEDLVLYIDNTYELYGQKKSIQKNLIRKLTKGTYDASLAPRIWMYLAEAGAKMWAQQLEGYDLPWHKLFPVPVRQEAAQVMADNFMSEYEDAQGSGMEPMEYFGLK